MTLNDFAKKYGIPYHAVYEVTYKVQPKSIDVYDREYSEQELLAELRKRTDKLIDKHSRLLANAIMIKGRISAE